MMRVVSLHPHLTEEQVREALCGLPETDYEVTVKPLRYRTQPRLTAYTIFDDRTITLQVPEPFFPFGDVVQYGAKRLPGRGMRFVPLSAGVTMRSRADVIRYLYCHEWYHWFLYEVRGKGWQSEAACERFALHNYRRREVTIEDAWAALRRSESEQTRRRAPSLPIPIAADAD